MTALKNKKEITPIEETAKKAWGVKKSYGQYTAQEVEVKVPPRDAKGNQCKTQCFAYVEKNGTVKCKALTVMDCAFCPFYKSKSRALLETQRADTRRVKLGYEPRIKPNEV